MLVDSGPRALCFKPLICTLLERPCCWNTRTMWHWKGYCLFGSKHVYVIQHQWSLDIPSGILAFQLCHASGHPYGYLNIWAVKYQRSSLHNTRNIRMSVKSWRNPHDWYVLASGEKLNIQKNGWCSAVTHCGVMTCYDQCMNTGWYFYRHREEPRRGQCIFTH